VVNRDLGELVPERALARADDMSVRRDAVRLSDGRSLGQRLA